MRRSLYYSVKPFLPQAARMAIRRRLGNFRRKALEDVWPISPSSATSPENWTGWPDGKQFCFALSHDVEGKRGYNRVKALAELEMEYGFRSSFNFIPEGEYKVEKELIDWLVERGFEVGVHDLKHDGHLYASRDQFSKSAKKINQYAKDWGGVGFRSGFMLHNLDWIHDLNIKYDASTFDTDPFEPQPEGVNTIFPFWVSKNGINGQKSRVADYVELGKVSPITAAEDTSSPNSQRHDLRCQRRSTVSRSETSYPDPSIPDPQLAIRNRYSTCRSGYVELPYTLPQDSTLFLLFREKNSNVWKSKLDWIAEKGGMVFLNLHPDYIALGGRSPRLTEFPGDRYRELLSHLKENYSRGYWHALPKEVANFCEGRNLKKATRVPKRVCVLAFTDYESDGRVIRYSKTLVDRGDCVDVFACCDEDEGPSESLVDGVRLNKIQARKRKLTGGPISYFFPLLIFAIRSSYHITKNHLQKRYDVVHVHNIPEWLVFSAWLPKLMGSRIILDLHDLVPELFDAKFRKSENKLLVWILRKLERLSCWFSDHVIISNDIWKNTVIARSVNSTKCSVFVNNIDPELFYPREKSRVDNRKIVLFPGTLQWHQGIDIAIRAFPKVRAAIPAAEFHIYGGGGVVDDLKALATELDLEDIVLFKEKVPITKMPQIIADADLGVVPKRADSFGNEAYSTKIMEFMSQRLPTVISRTAIDTFYFSENETVFCESGNVDQFAEAMIKALTDESLRERLIENASAYVARNDWNSRKQDYFEIVDDERSIFSEPAIRANTPKLAEGNV